MSTETRLYDDIAKRTKGDIYFGVVGPVRTGKSTFAKRFMEKMVIPYIENVYQRERAIDEMPQSGSGKTLTTSEPKFVPEEAVIIAPYENMSVSVRMIDSVGYMIPGVIGADEDGKPRMVTTPWYPEEIPMTQAAEIGTKKVMNDHCTIGIVVSNYDYIIISDISKISCEARCGCVGELLILLTIGLVDNHVIAISVFAGVPAYMSI